MRMLCCPLHRALLSVALPMILGLSARAASDQPAQPIPAGQVIETLHTLENPSQSYALYLPSTYTADRAWPLLMAFDPSAEGIEPVRLFREAAEKYGYIVVGSNNSRNGPTRRSADAFNAMWQDLHTRFRLDDRRIYAAGFSGAARFSSLVASSCQCMAGVILSGAGFPPDRAPAPGLKFAVYTAIGNFDFNYPELIQLRLALERSQIAHHLDIFDAGHQWLPPELARAALEWFNLQAMAGGVLPRDEAFVTAQWTERLRQAQAQEQSRDVYQAYYSYSSLVDDFRALRDVAEAKSAVERLRNSAEFHRAQASIDDQIRKQNSISNPIIARMGSVVSNPAGGDAGFSQPPGPGANPGRPASGVGSVEQDSSGPVQNTRQQLEAELAGLRKQRERETNPEKLAVIRRAQGAVIGYAYDSGMTLMDNKNYRAAALYFELATLAGPKSSAGLHYHAAAAYSLAGDKKQALRILRQAVAEGFDDRVRLEKDPDFERLRSTPEFEALVAKLPAK